MTKQLDEIKRLEAQLQAETKRVVLELDFSPASMQKSNLIVRQLLLLRGLR